MRWRPELADIDCDMPVNPSVEGRPVHTFFPRLMGYRRGGGGDGSGVISGTHKVAAAGKRWRRHITVHGTAGQWETSARGGAADKRGRVGVVGRRHAAAAGCGAVMSGGAGVRWSFRPCHAHGAGGSAAGYPRCDCRNDAVGWGLLLSFALLFRCRLRTGCAARQTCP